MGSDAPPDRYKRPSGITLNIGVADALEAARLFERLAEGGEVQMPLAETFWALRFGMLTDRFEISRMMNCQKPGLRVGAEWLGAGVGWRGRFRRLLD